MIEAAIVRDHPGDRPTTIDGCPPDSTGPAAGCCLTALRATLGGVLRAALFGLVRGAVLDRMGRLANTRISDLESALGSGNSATTPDA